MLGYIVLDVGQQTLHKVIKIKSFLARAPLDEDLLPLFRVNYQLLEVMLLKQPNGQLLAAVGSSQLRTMAPETAVPIENIYCHSLSEQYNTIQCYLSTECLQNQFLFLKDCTSKHVGQIVSYKGF